MSQERYHRISFAILGVCGVTIVLPTLLFEFMEIDIAVGWTMKFFALPIAMLMVPTFTYLFFRFIRHDLKPIRYTHKFLAMLRSIGAIVTLSLGGTLILIGTTLSLIILTNAYIGKDKEIQLDAIVVDYYERSSKGRKKQYIKIRDRQLDRNVELRVSETFEVGESFRKTMRIGHWGLLFSTD